MRNVFIIEIENFTYLDATELPFEVNHKQTAAQCTYMALPEGFCSFLNRTIVFWSGQQFDILV